MATVNSKMTALADEIRELSGATDTKSLDEMKVDVDAANAEIAEQTELLEQIAAALEGKAGGATLPTLDNPAVAADILSGKEAIDGDGNVITGTIATRTSSNLTASGATVTVPAGYYASQATKSVATATQATPSVSIDANGKITASATQTAGYVSAGVTTGKKQMTTQAAKTITPSTSSQTAVAKNVYTTGAVTVAAIPSNYEDVGTETNAYTTKLASLETAVAALESELEGKASGGSGGNGNVDICTVTIDNEIYYAHWELFYSCLIDGKVELVATDLGSESKILENVIKNSYITVKIDSYDISISSSTFSGGVSVVKTFEPSGTSYAGECMSVWQVTSDGTVAIGS